MRHRNYFAIGGFTLALLSTTVLAGHAFAQKGESMQPLSGWSSTSVSDKGSASYCAVARRFDGNVILTIARNKRTETSLALDFDQGGFARDTVFPVSLDPGAGEQRSMTVKPASDKAFVFKLGKDENFYRALVKTGFLRTEINGQNYNFNLSDIDAGKEKLATCLSQIGMPVADSGGAGAPAVSANTQTNVSANGEKLEELSRRLARLESENNRLRNGGAASSVTVASAAETSKNAMTPELPPVERVALKPLNDAIGRDDVSSPAPVMPPVLSAKAPAVSNSKAPVAVATAPQARAVPAFVPAESNGSVTKVDASVLVSMAEENRKLKAQLAEKSDLVDPVQLAQLNSRLKMLEKENKTLASASNDDTQTIARLSEENDRLTSALSAVQTAAGDEAGNTDEERRLQDRLADLIDQNSQYASKIAAYETQISRLEEELAAPKSVDNTDYTAAIAALKQQVADARAENDMLKTENAAGVKNAGQLQAELTTLKDQMDGVRAEKETLAAKAEGVQAEKEALATKVEGLQAEKEMLAAKVESVQAQAEQIAALEEKAQAKEKEAETLRLTLDDLKQENETLKHAALDDKAKSSETALNLADMQDKLDKLTLENEGLRTDLKETRVSQSDIEALKSANMELASLLDEAGELTVSQQDDLSEQQKKIEELSRQIDEGSHEETAALEEQIKTLSEENKALKDDLGAAQVELISLKQNAGEAISRELETALSNVPGQKSADNADDKDSDEAVADNTPAALIPDITEGHATESVSPAVENLAEVLSLRDESTQTDEEGVTAPAEDDDAALSGHDEMAAATVEAVPAEAPKMVIAKAPVPTFKPPYKSVSVAQKTDDADIRHEADTQEVAAADPQDLNDIETASGDSALESEDLLGLSQEDDEDLSLSEAQRQEKAMAREIDQRNDVDVVVPPAKTSVSDTDDGASVAAVSLDDTPIETEDLSAPVDRSVDKDDSDTTSSSGEGAVLARLSDSDDASSPLKEEDHAAISPVEADADVKTDAEEKQAAVFAPSMPIEKILEAAHIPVDGSVKMLADVSGPAFLAYQWHSQGGVFGSAQQKPVHGEGEFDSLVQAYLSKTEARCQGDFAIDPSSTQETGGTRIDTYEIACVGGGTDSSASLLFVSQGGTFTVVAHESPTDGMSTAMDYRDRLIESLRKS